MDVMPGSFSLAYNRRHIDAGGTIGVSAAGAGRLPCRYYATERRRHRYSSFSIMKWFRRSKHYDDDGDDDDDSAWFRDDLQRIRQAYAKQEADYAAITPVAARHRPMAASTWSKWSGSTTTVYSFAYVDGAARDDDEKERHLADDDDVVEYIDAATLPVAHRRRIDIGQRHSPSTTAGTSARTSGSVKIGTTTTTRRSNKKAAPPPPVLTVEPPTSTVVVGAANTATVQRRVAGTISRKKYRAPQPPADGSEPRPLQQQRGPGRRTAPVQRRRKGPAPKPPVVQQLQPQGAITSAAAASAGVEPEAGSNVKRKISQYERDRLMQRVDKIEKHFLDKTVTAPKAQTTEATFRHGFGSPAALYTAMAATNLTELDKRAADICRQRNHREIGVPLAVPLTADHKNAIVTAVIRKSYPKTIVAAANDNKRSDKVPAPSAVDDEMRIVRHKRLAFFQQQRPTGRADQRETVAGDNGSASGMTTFPKLFLHRTQTVSKSATAVTVEAKTSKVDETPAANTVVQSGGSGCSSAAGTV